MSIINVSKIEKAYDLQDVLTGTSFELHPGERIGLIGKNGAGKTTLFRIITGREKPDDGKIIIAKNSRIECLDQIPIYKDDVIVSQILEQPFSETLRLEKEMKKLEHEMSNVSKEHLEDKISRYDAIQQEFEAKGGYEIEEKIRQVSVGLKISKSLYSRSFNTLSGGEQTRITLARILLSNPDAILLDEPTNHLDIESVEWLEEFLKKYQGGVLIVSHDRYFLDRAVNKLLILHKGKTTKFSCNYSHYALELKNRNAAEWNEYRKEQKVVRKLKMDLKKSIDRNSRKYSTFMAAKIRELSSELNEKKHLSKPKDSKKIVLNVKADSKTSKIVVRLENVSKSFGSKSILKNTNWMMTKHEKIAIIGPNGAGKSTLIKMIMNQMNPDYGYSADSGKVYVGAGIKAGYLDQEIKFDNLRETILENFKLETGLDEGKSRSELAKFLFYADDMDKQIYALSGGEKTRLKLSVMMQKNLNTLILDEPTNHLDIDSREVLETTLKEFQGNVLMVSHDRYFINQIATCITEINDTKIKRYDGDYDDYRLQKEKENLANVSKKENESVTDWKAKNRLKNKTKAIEKELIRIEKEIENLENQIIQLEEEIEKHDSDYESVNKVYLKQQEVKSHLEKLYEKWSDLSEGKE